MGSTFFSSWQLWEKMTFVLGIAIFGVFCMGYAKVLWRNRLLKRQEIVDEEKRTRIEALRSTGQIVESGKSHDIPFGVRAIQSGIQVDGIWISNNNSPVPSEHKLELISKKSTSPEAANSSSTIKASTEAPQQPARPSSRQGRPMFKTRTSAGSALEPDRTSTEQPGSAGNRTSYKPRRASHLRYGSYGEAQYDEETLGQLEGHPSSKKKINTHRPRASRQIEPEADASAADNENSSSSDSDATLSNNMLLPNRKSELVTPTLSNVPSNKVTRSSFPVRSSKAEYFPVPNSFPDYEAHDPFLTPQRSPTEATPPTNYSLPRMNPTADVELDSWHPHRSQNRPPSIFIPGELHVNKAVRKVNSGFEVLPAGTFGVSANRGNDHDLDERSTIYDESGDRRQSKLQKKRQSTEPRRPSSTMERP